MYALYSVILYCSGDAGILGKYDPAGNVSLPEGKIKMGETPREAVARVLKEETGLEIDPGQVSIFYQTNAEDKIALVYYVERNAMKGDLVQPTNGNKLGWFQEKSFFAGSFAKLNKDIMSHV